MIHIFGYPEDWSPQLSCNVAGGEITWWVQQEKYDKNGNIQSHLSAASKLTYKVYTLEAPNKAYLSHRQFSILQYQQILRRVFQTEMMSLRF